MKIAVFPGSFDPITNGHVDVIRRMAPLFDKVIVAIGINQNKKYLFSLEQRTEMINAVFHKEDNILCDAYEGLTVDFCKKTNAQYLIRGLRSSKDFDYEKQIAILNLSLSPIETMFLVSRPEYAHISSSAVREIRAHGGDVSAFIPKEISDFI